MTIKAAPPYNKTEIKDLTKDQLVHWFETRAMRSFRALQVMRWIYLRQVDTFEQMTDINKTTRTLLSASFDNKRLVLRQTETSADGSQKFLFQLGDGNTIESVLIPEKEHDTLCISSQVGCAQGCRFCMTAKGGLIRNLFTWEIIAQVRDIQQLADHSGRLTNIVITDGDTGLKFSNRRVTLSTAGLVPKMQRLGKDTQVNLAISLNAADNAVRSRLMPVNRKYPLEKLLDACAAYPLKRRKKITFEYILIKGVNDSAADAESLAVLLKKLPSKINLIPYNEHAGSPFERPDESTIEQFQNILINNNFTTIIRRSKGRDIAAACGQLRARYMEP
ncbi:MAG: 23S rRNA (adenine(2503)-C(2))-methyltransferase RlmN [Deltaproteobacteria bacterium]